MTVLAVAITLVAFVLLRTMSRSWTERVAQTPNDRVGDFDAGDGRSG